MTRSNCDGQPTGDVIPGEGKELQGTACGKEAGGSMFYAYDATTGLVKWTYETDNWIWSSPTITANGEIVYVGSLDGKMHAVNALSGTKNFTYDTGGEVWSSPILSFISI